jgi:hypothetical protein
VYNKRYNRVIYNKKITSENIKFAHKQGEIIKKTCQNKKHQHSRGRRGNSENHQF